MCCHRAKIFFVILCILITCAESDVPQNRNLYPTAHSEGDTERNKTTHEDSLTRRKIASRQNDSDENLLHGDEILKKKHGNIRRKTQILAPSYAPNSPTLSLDAVEKMVKKKLINDFKDDVLNKSNAVEAYATNEGNNDTNKFISIKEKANKAKGNKIYSKEKNGSEYEQAKVKKNRNKQKYEKTKTKTNNVSGELIATTGEQIHVKTKTKKEKRKEKNKSNKVKEPAILTDEDESVTTDAAYSTFSPTSQSCVGESQMCKFSSGCCDGLYCNIFSFTCESLVPPTAAPTINDSCVKEGTKCKVFSPCCDGLQCNLKSLTCEKNDLPNVTFPTSSPSNPPVASQIKTPTAQTSSKKPVNNNVCVAESQQCQLSTACCDGMACNLSSMTCEKQAVYVSMAPSMNPPSNLPANPPSNLPSNPSANPSANPPLNPPSKPSANPSANQPANPLLSSSPTPKLTSLPTFSPSTSPKSLSPTNSLQKQDSSPNISLAETQESENCIGVNERCKLWTPCCQNHACDVTTMTCQLIADVNASLDALKEDAIASLDTLGVIGSSTDV